MIVYDTEDDSSELLAAGKSGFDKRVTQIAAITDCGKMFHNRGNVAEFFRVPWVCCWMPNCHKQTNKHPQKQQAFDEWNNLPLKNENNLERAI